MVLSCSPFPPTPPYTCGDAPFEFGSHSALHFLRLGEELPPFETVNPQQVGGLPPDCMEDDDIDRSGAADPFAYPSPTFGCSTSATPALVRAMPLLEHDPSPEMQSLFDNFPSLPSSPYSSFGGTPFSSLFANPGSWSQQGGSDASTSTSTTPNFTTISRSEFPENLGGDYWGPSPLSTPASPASDAPVSFAADSSAIFEWPEPRTVGRPVREWKRSSASLGRAQSTKKRKPTETRYDPSIPYPLNEAHDFVVYRQALRKLDVSERWVTKLTLVVAPSASPFERAAWGMHTYSRADYEEQCTTGTTYVFEDANSGLWDVVYSRTGPSITPRTPPTSSTATLAPIYTFVHFPPGTMTNSDKFPIGHRHWWRVQACIGNGGARHRSMPADGPGEWTARYDVQDNITEPRRPARCVEHFAQCHLRTHDAMFPLSVLARAIRTTLQ